MRHTIVLLFAIMLLYSCASPNITGDIVKLSSPAFAEGKPIPADYTCEGADRIPPLEISDIPANAKSLALVVDDPDAPMGTWDHWIVWNIPPDTKKIDAEPSGVGGKNSWGRTGYGGPCPPSGTHRYFFKLYALDVMLDLPAGSNKASLEQAMKDHIVEQAQLIGTYQKKG